MENEITLASVQAEVNKTVEALIAGGVITVIENQGQMENANALMKETKTKIKAIIEQRKSLIAPLEQKIDEINNFFRPIVDLDRKNPNGKLDRLVNTLEAPMIAYTKLCEAQRAEKQRLIDEEVRRKNEADRAKEREKLEAEEALRREADKKRREAEEAEQKKQQAIRDAAAAEQRAKDAKNKAAREKAEKEQCEAYERAQKEQDAKEKAQADALKADKRADKSAYAAEQARESSTTRVAHIVESAAKVKGFSVTTNYKPEVFDEIAAKKYCLEQEKYHYLLLDMKVIGGMVTHEKLNFKMPGIKVVEDLGSRSR